MSAAERSLTVVKVGGSLYDLADLGPRLRAWLRSLSGPVLLVPGGGAAVDVVREQDRRHELGEEVSHWLALRALTFNAHFLQALLPGSAVIAHPAMNPSAALTILDAHAFALADEGKRGCLPHTWEVTSDSIAARAAVVAGARRLVLLKSVPTPAGMTWEEAGRLGLVDSWLSHVLCEAPHLEVSAVNLRAEKGHG
ncbi:MAG: hypothetical protein L0Z62_19575 [Gemmataceae bacterium]|nr:hypothetical protein [Gemmataceae bacterium]